MELSKNTPDSLVAQSSSEAASNSPLKTLPVSEYLRNLANQTVIQTQRADLIARVRDYPEDNSPRYAYADHLESHPLTIRDTARGELIRLQIARGESEPTVQEREILTRFERTWMQELGHVRGVTWDRGFITGITMAPRHFAQGLESLSREPIKQWRINLPGGSDEGGKDLQAAIQAPHFKWIERLSFWLASPATLLDLENLLGSPDSKLREVHFERFSGSIQGILETCSRVSYPKAPSSPHHPLLTLGDIAITFGEMR